MGNARWYAARSFCFLALLSSAGSGSAQTQRSTFDILKGDDVVGSIAASCSGVGDRTLYVMTSFSTLDLVWKQVVNTAVVTEYDTGVLRSCRASVHVNGSVRDSSNMVPEGDGHLCYVHPKGGFHREQAPSWTTARMYFEEPVGQEHIFVESVLEPCAIRSSSPGTYHLTFPNGAENRYVYQEGKLQEIHVDRTFLDLVFRRRSDVDPR